MRMEALKRLRSSWKDKNFSVWAIWFLHFLIKFSPLIRKLTLSVIDKSTFGTRDSIDDIAERHVFEKNPRRQVVMMFEIMFRRLRSFRRIIDADAVINVTFDGLKRTLSIARAVVSIIEIFVNRSSKITRDDICQLRLEGDFHQKNLGEEQILKALVKNVKGI